MTALWDVRTLEELCNFKNGLWKGKKGPFIEAGVIRNTNFTKDGRLDDSDIAYLEVEKKQFETRQLEYGDLILEKSGGGPKQPVGRVILFSKRDGDFSFSNFTSIIRIKEQDRIYFRFLHWYLHFLYVSGATEPMQKHSTNIRNLQLKEYKKIQVPLPGKTEQKRIVAILDDAFAGIETAIANTEKNLDNAQELFESQLENSVRHAIADEGLVALSELATDITDGDHMPPPKSADGLPFITIRNIEKGTRTIDFADTFKVPEDYYDSLKPNRRPANGDVLYTVTGSYGIPVRVETDKRFCFQRHIGLIRPKSGVSSKWLEYMLLSQFVRDQADAGATGTAQKTVSLRLLRSFEIPNQNAIQQREVVSRLDTLAAETQRLNSIYAQKRSVIAELKQSLLQKAFSGELTAHRAEGEVESAIG